MTDPAALLALLQEATPELTWIPRVAVCYAYYHAQNTLVCAGTGRDSTEVYLWLGGPSVNVGAIPPLHAARLPADAEQIANYVYVHHSVRLKRPAADVQRFCTRMRAQRDFAVQTNKLAYLQARLVERRQALETLAVEIEECKHTLNAAAIKVRDLRLSARGST